MAASKASQMDMFFSGLNDSSGNPLSGYKLYFWTSSAATTVKDVFLDINKASVIDQTSGIALGTRGEKEIYGDGEYFVQVKTAAGVLFETFTVAYSASVNFGGLYIDVGADFGTSGANIQTCLDGLNASLNYTLLFKDATFTISQDLLFNTNVVVKGMLTATMAISAGITATINRTPEIPDFQFFTGAGSVAWGSAVQEVRDIWTTGDATTQSLELKKGLFVGGSLSLGGSLTYKLVTKTATYTAANEYVIGVDASSGAASINLRSAASVAGLAYYIYKSDSSANIVTIDPDGSETINGDSTKELIGQYGYIKIVSDGTNWRAIGFDSGWGVWSPTYGAGGSMTYTAVTSHVARYKMNLGVVTLELVARGTTGGSASPNITLTLPKAPGNADTSNVHPAVSCFTENTGSGDIGYIRFSSGSAMDVFRNPGGNNWSLGADCGLNLLMTYEV